MTAKPLVYVAGPYTNPDPVMNTNEAIRVANDELLELCHPVVPHLTMLWHMVRPHGLAHWYEYDLAIMERCDAVVRIPGASSGADNEILHATKLGMPVFAWPLQAAEFSTWTRNYREVSVPC